MDYKTAVFDLDGTLLDSMLYWRSIAKYTLEKHGVSVPDELYRKSLYMFTGEALEMLKKELHADMSIKCVAEDFVAVLAPAYKNVVMPKPHVPEFLEYLKKSGIRLCIATATDRELFLPALDRLSLSGYFDAIITTSEVGKSKNHPDVFDRAAALCETEKQDCVIFEDALYSIKTAVSNGYRVIAVEDEYARDDKSEIMRLCSDYIKDYNDYLPKGDLT